MTYLRAFLFSCLLCSSLTARAGTIELALLLDGSGSVGSDDWDLQINAYKEIFGSGSFYDDFVADGDTLVVRAWQFATEVTDISGGWFEINNNADAVTFSETLVAPWSRGWTNTLEAVTTAVTAIRENSYSGDRLVIDISTDGNPCLPDYLGGCPLSTGPLASLVASEGITVNMIGVGPGIDTKYMLPLIDASGGFIVEVDSFDGFRTGLESKLAREISMPAPASLVLFSLGLLVLAMRRRERT